VKLSQLAVGFSGSICVLGVLTIAGCGGSSSGAVTDGGAAGTAGSSSVAGTASGGNTANGGSSAQGGASNGGSMATTAGTANGGTATGGAGSCNTPTPGAAHVCASYTASTIAAMRMGKTSGCFELGHVGLIARTDSPAEPRLYVQDSGGADFSAILAKCASTAGHACSATVRAKIPQLYDTLEQGAQLTLQGYYLNGGVTGFEQLYIEDIIDECKMTTRPTPISIAPADIGRDARLPAKWFQRAEVTIPANDPLVVYDFSPAELHTVAQACPTFVGFAMIPKSAGSAAATACSGKANPPAQALDPKEVLIGRQFFNKFLFGADCACAQGTGEMLITATSSVSGTVRGYLILEVDKGSTNPYQVFEPAADKTFPLK
jgi:hypothetical protein